MNVSVAVMAHPARLTMVQELLGTLDVPATVAWDEIANEWHTGRRALLAYDRDAEYHVVLQDDAIVCADLAAGVAKLAGALPGPAVLGLYLGAVRPYGATVERAVNEADALGASWVVSERLMWGVGTAIPVAAIDRLVAGADTNRAEEYDFRVSSALRRVGLEVWYPLPSLVDHRLGPSLLAHPDQTRSARRFLGVGVSALEHTWSTTTVCARTPRAGRITYAKRPDPTPPG